MKEENFTKEEFKVYCDINFLCLYNTLDNYEEIIVSRDSFLYNLYLIDDVIKNLKSADFYKFRSNYNPRSWNNDEYNINFKEMLSEFLNLFEKYIKNY